MLEIKFWNKEPDLEAVKKNFSECVNSSESKYKQSCIDIANSINFLDVEANLNKPKGRKRGLLIYGDDTFSKINGLLAFTKYGDIKYHDKDVENHIYIDQLAGFNKSGKKLLSFILNNALRCLEYNYVEIEAASMDKCLASYYKSIGEENNIKSEIYGENHVKFTLIDSK